MGEIPSTYTLIQAAKYLGVPPWELLNKPTAWRDWAIMYANAEAFAAKGPEVTKYH